MSVILTTSEKKLRGVSADIVIIDEAADLDNSREWMHVGSSFEDHYREKALSLGQRFDEYNVGIDWSVSYEDTSCLEAHGPQTPQQSKRIKNRKKERPWKSKQSRKLPPWMRR